MTFWSRRRGDLVALGLLIGIPLVVFAIPAAAGYPLLTGDNIIQNYPLRVLAGEILAHGHLPIYNPFGWAGTPLLASANATVAFPDIALFAFLPGIVAWVGVEVVAFGGAAVGLYCFLRCEGLEPLPAGIGGALYGLGGYVSSQAIHLDVVQTAASLAFVLVALQRIGRGPSRHLLGWTAFLGLAVATTGLSGNPESDFYAALGAGIFAISVVVSSTRRLRATALIVLGTIAGGLIASIQVVPADRFVAVSQRAAVPFAFLTQGSVRPAELSLVALPHLLGGGLIGLRHYVGGANLAEIDVYPGLVALVGVVALLFLVRSPNASRIRVWYLIGAIGVLVALGPATFVPHVVRHLPVVGESRLPSRALVLLAASFSVLGGFVSAEFLDPGSALPRREDAARSVLWRALEKWSVVVPSLAVFALAIAAVVGGAAFARSVAGRDVGHWTVWRVAPYLGVSCALALFVGVVFVVGPRLSRRRRSVVLIIAVALDLLLFTVNQTSLAPIRSKDLGRPNRYEVALQRSVGPNGRFVVVDHGRGGRFVLDDLGAPNLNVLFKIPSAQGYGSLTWGPYAAATGTHDQDTASPSAFSTSVFDSLDVRALLVLPSSFESDPARPGRDQLRLESSGGTTRYFGEYVDVRSICVGYGYTPLQSIAAFESRAHLIGATSASAMHFVRASCGEQAAWSRDVARDRDRIPRRSRRRDVDRCNGDDSERANLRPRRRALSLGDASALGGGRTNRSVFRLPRCQRQGTIHRGIANRRPTRPPCRPCPFIVTVDADRVRVGDLAAKGVVGARRGGAAGLGRDDQSRRTEINCHADARRGRSGDRYSEGHVCRDVPLRPAWALPWRRSRRRGRRHGARPRRARHQ